MTQHMNLRVCEIFKSIQGESSFAGLPFVIVRTTGCNLRCSYCDTQYAWKEGREIEILDLIQLVRDFETNHVLLTGGEPLSQIGSFELANRLALENFIVLVETNGTMDISPLASNVVTVMDIKCPGSQQTHMMNWDNISALRPTDEVKFVISDRADYEWAKEIISKYFAGFPQRILMSAVFGKLSTSDLAGWILSDNLRVRLQLQLHKYIWPDKIRGV
jgi:7-carboxy-7-deazaguanine synthase